MLIDISMKYKSLLILFYAAVSSLGSTISASGAIGSVSGKLIDESTNAALDYVNVVIYKKNSDVPVNGTATAKDGTFVLKGIETGEYKLEGSFIGYQPFSREIVITSDKDFNLGTIKMKTDSHNLSSVEVRGIRSAMKFDIDKRVFSVDQSIASAGASASDILKNIPSVNVDAQGTISLRNSTDVTIWINGKPSGLNSDNQADVLEQMPAESIEKIEVITNPSSKFSSEGSAGIINLILKKDRKAGYYGSIRAGVSDPSGYRLGGNFNYSSPKLDFYANIGRGVRSNDGGGYSNRMTFSENQLTGLQDTSYLNSKTSRSINMHGLFFRSGIDYHINKEHTISLSGFGMDGSRDNDSKIDYNYLDNLGNLTKSQIRNSESNGGHNNFDITLNYLWEIAEGHRFQTNFTYGEHDISDNSLYYQQYFGPTGDMTGKLYQKQTGPSHHNDYEFQADYTHKFSDKFQFDAGLKSDVTIRGSHNSIYDYKNSEGDFDFNDILDESKSVFDYNEKINAAYSTFTGKVGPHFGYQLGLRGELTNISFTSTNNATNDYLKKDKDYFNLFPTVFITWNFFEGSDLQFNYSRRINRPRGRMINPYVNISDSTNIWIGNPSLDPEYANSFELNFMRNWDNHMLSSSLYYRQTEGVIQSIRYINNGVMYQTPSNVTNSSSSGLELISKDHFSSLLETTSTIDFYNTEINGFKYKDTYYKPTSGFSWNARINGTFVLSKSLTAEIACFYNAPTVVAQGKNFSSYSVDAGIRKSLMDGRLKLSLNSRNIFNSFNSTNESWGNNFYQKSSDKFSNRIISIEAVWSFGNMKPKKKLQKEENNEESNGMETDY